MTHITNLDRDYLAEIYLAGHIESAADHGVVSSAELADRLFANQSTINRVIARLRDAELIAHERYVGVALTPRGQAEAVNVLRKQAIIESFLVNVMGFAWHEIYQEAKRLRYGTPDVVLERMWEKAGRPERSPFGEWINPSPDNLPGETLLANTAIKRDYTTTRVLTRQADRLQYLAVLGLQPGARLHLLHKAPFDGPIQCQLATEYRIIGHALARMLAVVPVE